MRDSSPRSRWLVVARVAVAVPPLLLALMAYRRRWTCDDAFIVFRVVGNLVAGHGPVFNLDERVEAYTSPAWLALLALWRRLGGPLEMGAVALGLLFAVLGLIAAEAGSARLLSRGPDSGSGRSLASKRAATDSRHLVLPAGALLFAALPPVWDFSTSGLEMGLVFAWLGATFWGLATVASARSSPPRFAGARPSRWDGVAILAGIGPLVRPDLALFSATFLIALLFCHAEMSAAAGTSPGAWRRIVSMASLRLLAAALLLPLGYELFRMGYFAALVANSALAKEPGAANWARGWAYLRDFAGTYALWIPGFALLAVALAEARGASRRDRATSAVLWAPVAGAVLHALFVVRLGGDFMHARMLLPALWGAAMPLAVVAVPNSDGRPRRSRQRVPRSWQTLAAWGGCVVVAVWAVLCAATLRIHYGPRNDGPDGITDERGFYVREARRPHPIVSVDFLHVPFAVDGMGLGELANSSRALEVTGGTAAAVAGPRGLLVDATDSPVRQRLPRGDVRFYPLTPSVPAGVRVVVGRWNVGLTGYLAGPRVHVVDRHGLADALAARLRRQPGGRPGHDKILRNDWMVARFSTVEPSGPNRADVVAARHALQCRPLSDLLAAIQEPLTFQRFVANVALASRLHRLRVPADPVAAERELCAGAGS